MLFVCLSSRMALVDKDDKNEQYSWWVPRPPVKEPKKATLMELQIRFIMEAVCFN